MGEAHPPPAAQAQEDEAAFEVNWKSQAAVVVHSDAPSSGLGRGVAQPSVRALDERAVDYRKFRLLMFIQQNFGLVSRKFARDGLSCLSRICCGIVCCL